MAYILIVDATEQCFDVRLIRVYVFSSRSLAEACSDGDVPTVRKLLHEGGSVHETTEEGESLLSLACSAGYYELAQVSHIASFWLWADKGIRFQENQQLLVLH